MATWLRSEHFDTERNQFDTELRTVKNRYILSGYVSRWQRIK